MMSWGRRASLCPVHVGLRPCEPQKLWAGEGLVSASLLPELSSPYQPTNISRNLNPTDDAHRCPSQPWACFASWS